MSDDVTITVGVGPEGGLTVSVTPTLDFYTDSEGHTHVVIGEVHDGVWEIVADFTIPGL